MKDIPPSPPRKTIVVVGLMGAGKTSIGRRLARRLGVPFVEADAEIVKAAEQPINATMSGLFSRSWLRTVAITCVSQR